MYMNVDDVLMRKYAHAINPQEHGFLGGKYTCVKSSWLLHKVPRFLTAVQM